MAKLLPLFLFLAAVYTAFKPQINEYLRDKAAENRRKQRDRHRDTESDQ